MAFNLKKAINKENLRQLFDERASNPQQLYDQVMRWVGLRDPVVQPPPRVRPPSDPVSSAPQETPDPESPPE